MEPKNTLMIGTSHRGALFPVIAPIAAVCFVGAFVTDINYWRTADIMWADFSAWLLAAGLVLGVLAAIAAIVDFFRSRLIQIRGPRWLYVCACLLAWLVSLFNALVHSRDAWTSVVPMGLVLSAVTFLLIIGATVAGWPRAYGAISGGLE
jgi:uncharacterized membrane protein